MIDMIEIQHVHKSYSVGNKEIQVLKGIDLRIEKGAFLALVGPSGAGKSTLLHILGGLDEPTRGKVFFEGQDIHGLNDKALSRLRNRKIGFIFQFYHLLPEFTALENVMMPALVGLDAGPGQNSGSVRERAQALLHQMGLSRRAGHFPSQLSGGEQQRVAIARALMNSPELLLCDEPTGNLDLASGAEIVAEMKQINRREKVTIILVTHNLELAKTSDTIYRLTDGILVN
ncbi:MAG TPA: ABC transporter ATP-binding protein [Candidatus Omnitrophota bacterium]|nr:ABC transporter ATP-binding protein [Candidatus Omnitrophota bacterium]